MVMVRLMKHDGYIRPNVLLNLTKIREEEREPIGKRGTNKKSLIVVIGPQYTVPLWKFNLPVYGINYLLLYYYSIDIIVCC